MGPLFESWCLSAWIEYQKGTRQEIIVFPLTEEVFNKGSKLLFTNGIGDKGGYPETEKVPNWCDCKIECKKRINPFVTKAPT